VAYPIGDRSTNPLFVKPCDSHPPPIG
jgi:hypothetical protein